MHAVPMTNARLRQKKSNPALRISGYRGTTDVFESLRFKKWISLLIVPEGPKNSVEFREEAQTRVRARDLLGKIGPPRTKQIKSLPSGWSCCRVT
jgi:hypothetical protein